MSDYPMLISNKLHSFRNFREQIYNKNINHNAYGLPVSTFAQFIRNRGNKLDF